MSMIETTDYMINYISSVMDGIEFKKEEVKTFETYTDLVMYIYNGDLEQFLVDIEGEYVFEENMPILPNIFYSQPNIIEDESFDYIYLLDV